jgi:hypothetical protein
MKFGMTALLNIPDYFTMFYHFSFLSLEKKFYNSNTKMTKLNAPIEFKNGGVFFMLEMGVYPKDANFFS